MEVATIFQSIDRSLRDGPAVSNSSDKSTAIGC
jgi:hypothetical protein